MSRINVDFVAFGDVRFARLAILLGYADHDHARSKVEYLWVECTKRCSPELPVWVVESLLGQAAPAALIDAELARWGRGRGDSKTRLIRIAGAEKRCLWQTPNTEQSRKGGKSRALSASRSAGRFISASQAPSQPAVQLKPGLPSPSPSPSPEISEPRTQNRETEQARPAQVEPLSLTPPTHSAPKPRAQPSGDHARVIAAYVDRYEHATGAKPRITGRTGGEVKSLLASHGADEVIRRLDVLASGSGPEWLYRDGSPWDFGTLVSQFDKLAKAAAPVPRGPGGVPAPPPRAMATLSGAAPMNLPPPLPPLALPHGDHDHDQGGPLDR